MSDLGAKIMRPSLRARIRRATVAAAMLAAAIATPAIATPAIAAPAGRTGPKPKQTLTAAERAASGIASASAADDLSLGLIVTVRFRGEVERYLGQGGLKGGFLALRLLSPSRQPGGLIDAGGGFLNPAPARNLNALARERVLAVNAPGRVEVIRHRNQVTFWIAGPEASQATGAEVELFTHGYTGMGNRGARSRLWQTALTGTPAHAATVTVVPGHLTAPQLTGLRRRLAATLSSRLIPELRRERQAAEYLGSVNAEITRLQREIADVRRLISRAGALINVSGDPAVQVAQTDQALGQQMTALPGLALSGVRPQAVPVIDVDAGTRYQRYAGVGATLTDSSAWLIANALPPTIRTALMQALFGPPAQTNALGAPDIHLDFLRVAIGASGAMTVDAPYSYDDLPAGGSDPSLSGFSIAHDQQYILPLLQQALSLNPGLEILANPWSPPGWMKSNGALDNLGALGTLLASAYQPLADYFVRFIQAYRDQGVPVAAITPQNEPSSGTSGTPYPGLTLPEPGEAGFIAQYLQPALRADKLDTKIYGSDLSWASASYAQGLASDAAAGGDLAGIAWHCYFGSPTVMTALQEATPGLDQIVDECSPEIRSFGTPEFLISSLRNYASTVAVWALALDPSGGPIEPRNDCPGCRGPVTIDEQSQTVSFRPEYYQLGQVSAFVQPGARRIASDSFVTYGVNASNIESVTPGLDDVAFLNPDGSEVLVAYNNSNAPSSFGVNAGGRYFTATLPARAMATFKWG